MLYLSCIVGPLIGCVMYCFVECVGLGASFVLTGGVQNGPQSGHHHNTLKEELVVSNIVVGKVVCRQEAETSQQREQP